MSQGIILRLLRLGIVALVLLGLPLQTPAAQSVSPPVTLVHLFEWKWLDVAKECETYLGPQGFSAVMVSPPNEHARVTSPAYPWWQRYQPVSYQIVSRSGNRAEFADMVTRCRNAGVQVYADVVINHMAAIGGTSIAGTSYSKYNHPGLYSSADFHWFVPPPEGCQASISNYQDRWNVQQCELVGLADLRTASAYVRAKIADYLVDLYNLGVRGYRIDAAKHIASADIRAILDNVNARVEPDPFIAQEVIDPGSEAVRKSEYYQNGSVYEFLYGSRLGEKFLNLAGQNIAQLRSFADASSGFAPTGQAVVFVDNHDKQRGHAGGGSYVTYKHGALYDLSNVFMLAWPYGYPQLMSSYAFDNADAGPPSDASGNTNSIYPAGSSTPACFSQQPGLGWVCEHRWRPIGNMVAFRNYTAPAASVSNWWDNGANQIAFGRGDRGFVVINREGATLSRTFQTGLPPGSYCDIIHGDFSVASRTCSGPAVAVGATGQATISVPAMSAVAIYGGAQLTASTPTSTSLVPSLTRTPTRTSTLIAASPTRTNTTVAGISVNVNFQPSAAPAHPGYLVDGGALYGSRGNGQTYGWNVDNTTWSRDRNAANSLDQRYDTLNHMQKGGGSLWEIALPNGSYTVRIVSGDPSNVDSVYNITAEGVTVVSGTPNSTTRWFDGARTVTVSDGRLTITNGPGSSNNKIAFLEIAGVASVTSTPTRTSTASMASATPTRTPNTTNLALSKPASASSSVNGAQLPGLALDGNQGSYWESANNAFPQSLTVDLGSAQSVSRVVLKLPAGWGARNQTIALSGSSDNASYTTLVGATSYAFSPTSANTVSISFAATGRRYLRLTISANSGWPAAQVSELEVY